MALTVGTNAFDVHGWRGFLSLLILLSTLSCRYHCADSYSNYINIDDDEDSTTTASAAIISPTTIAAKSSAVSTASIKQFSFASNNNNNNEEDDVIYSTTSSAFDFTFTSTERHQQQYHYSSEANEIPSYQYKFAHAIYNVTIPENSVQKTFAIQPYTDKSRMGIQLYDTIDATNRTHHIDVKYQIMDGDKNKIFKAEERVVGDFAFLTIRTRTNNIVLNREKGDNYRLRVRATITRSSKTGTKNRITQHAETLVDVKVLDRNDLSPLFYPTKYSITISDDTPLHQSILRVTAEDADVGINGGEC
jgi:hypothetical protein